jgi:hypothetical protein
MDRTVPAVAAGQAGVFTAEQARADGWSARQVERRRESGRWIPLIGRGLIESGTRITCPARVWATVLTWPEAVAGFRTAGFLHGFPIPDDGPVHVIVRRDRGALAGVVAHRIPVQPPPAQRAGLVMTSPQQTAADCLAGSSFEEALDLYAWLSSRKLVTRSDLSLAIRSRYARPGCAQLRRLISLTRSGAVSGAEFRLHELLRRSGITGWVAGARIEDEEGLIGRVDLLFPGRRVVIEVDGRRAHSSREVFVADRRRQNRLVAAGYVVLRFTWWDLVERPDGVIREIRAALA